MDELIELQSAHSTQYTKHGVPSDWYIKENITGKQLHVLPGSISDKDLFAVLDFARIYELKAFNAGIMYAKRQHNAPLVNENRFLREQLAEVLKHDAELAEKLEQLLTTQENN